jgi:hypothetical protein
MSDDPQIPNPPNGPTAVDPMSRRAFGQTIGAAAVGSTLQTALFGTASSDLEARARPLTQQPKHRADDLL